MDTEVPPVTELVASVAAAVSRQMGVVSDNVYEVILRDIPELRDDKVVLALLASSVHSNIGTCLQILQHQIELSDVCAPAAALEYARRLAQRGTSLPALLRSYPLGHTCFTDWLFQELARQADNAELITAATMGMSKIVAGYVDQTSEEIVAAYTGEREHWRRNRSAARAVRIRALWAWCAGRASRCSCPACSCPATNPAPGPGWGWGSGTGSTPPGPKRPAWTATCISRSATRPRAARDSA